MSLIKQAKRNKGNIQSNEKLQNETYRENKETSPIRICQLQTRLNKIYQKKMYICLMNPTFNKICQAISLKKEYARSSSVCIQFIFEHILVHQRNYIKLAASLYVFQSLEIIKRPFQGSAK